MTVIMIANPYTALYCCKCFPYISSFNLHQDPVQKVFLYQQYLHFTSENMETNSFLPATPVTGDEIRTQTYTVCLQSQGWESGLPSVSHSSSLLTINCLQEEIERTCLEIFLANWHCYIIFLFIKVLGHDELGIFFKILPFTMEYKEHYLACSVSIVI